MSMIETKLERLLNDAQKKRDVELQNGTAGFHYDYFPSLNSYIKKKMASSFFRKENIQHIVNNLDRILPFIVQSNLTIIEANINKFINQSNFSEKFIKGISKYPYLDHIDEIIRGICFSLKNSEINHFANRDLLETLSSMNLSKNVFRQVGVIEYS